MKKFLRILLVAVMILGCSSCTEKYEVSEDGSGNMWIELSEDCGIALVQIPSGKFKMGTYEGFGDEDELPVREIELTEDYYIGKFEITQKQWETVMGSNPSSFSGENLPVETVSWEECMEFCKKLSKATGLNVSLPTEAQWENACRSGSETKWFFGDDIIGYGKYANENTEDTTINVGSYEPNPYGLYDMYGNVMEWCLDYYSPEYMKEDVTDPKGPESGEARVSRGGGWGASPDECRSAYRNACGENEKTDGIGLRIVVNG